METKEPRPASREVLEEVSRQGDKVIEAQVRASEEGNNKSEQIVAVALLVIAGGAAAAQLVISNDAEPDGPFLILLSGGLICAAVSFGHVAQGYVGSGASSIELQVGWDPAELARIAVAGSYTRDEVLQAHAKAVNQWFHHNANLLSRLASKRIAGAWFLYGAGFLLGLAFLYGLVRLS